VPADEYSFPEGSLSSYRLGARELDMAQQLVSSMSGEWDPTQYRDEFRSRLTKVIEERLRQKGARVEAPHEEEAVQASDKVVDLMAVLRRSLAEKGGKPGGSTRAVPARRHADGTHRNASNTRRRRA
jgi:DNA end-binding protein Ku